MDQLRGQITNKLASIKHLPAHQDCTPGKTASHGFHQHQVPFLYPPVFESRIKRKRNGSSGCVCMAFNSHHHFIGIKPDFSSGSVKDPFIGLMWHEPVDLIDALGTTLKGFLDDVRNICDGMAEYFASLHPQMANRARGRGAAVYIQFIPVAAI